MSSECEWARYSKMFLPLRVTHKKGRQLSSYRLQLPYLWSIPLLVISAVLHWLFSNCIYLVLLESKLYISPLNPSLAGCTNNPSGHRPFYPYKLEQSFTGLLCSPPAILISLVLCIVVAIIPIGLAFVKLPGKMVVMGNCSAVISAACHCFPPGDLDSLISFDTRELSSSRLTEDQSEAATTGSAHDLYGLAVGKLKWGVLSCPAETSDGSQETSPGHLAFGSEIQDVGEVVEGQVYKGFGVM